MDTLWPRRIALLLALTLTMAPLSAFGKKGKKNVEPEPEPASEPATFEVFGIFLQDQVVYGFGSKMECDLYVYVVDGGAPVTDATVTVAGLDLPQDSWFEGRYRLQGSCVDPGAALPVRIERGTQVWEHSGTMPGFPDLQVPAKGAEVPVSADVEVSWTPADGGALYRVDVEGADGRWTTDQTSLAIPRDAIAPFQHHKMILTTYGLPVDPDAAVKPLSGAEPVWPGLTPVTRVTREFDFGPWLVDQNWLGDAVMQWWEDDGKTMDEDLFKIWLRLSPGGSYQIQRVKIAQFEQGMHFNKEIPWEDVDSGTVEIDVEGNMSLISETVEGWTWTGTYAAPELTLLENRPPTDDPDEKKRRRYQGAPKPWALRVGDVEPVEF